MHSLSITGVTRGACSRQRSAATTATVADIVSSAAAPPGCRRGSITVEDLEQAEPSIDGRLGWSLSRPLGPPVSLAVGYGSGTGLTTILGTWDAFFGSERLDPHPWTPTRNKVGKHGVPRSAGQSSKPFLIGRAFARPSTPGKQDFLCSYPIPTNRGLTRDTVRYVTSWKSLDSQGLSSSTVGVGMVASNLKSWARRGKSVDYAGSRRRCECVGPGYPGVSRKDVSLLQRRRSARPGPSSDGPFIPAAYRNSSTGHFAPI